VHLMITTGGASQAYAAVLQGAELVLGPTCLITSPTLQAIAQATKAQEAATAAGGRQEEGGSNSGADATAAPTYEPPDWGGQPDV
jgi:hypothetical protein